MCSAIVRAENTAGQCARLCWPRSHAHEHYQKCKSLNVCVCVRSAHTRARPRIIRSAFRSRSGANARACSLHAEANKKENNVSETDNSTVVQCIHGENTQKIYTHTHAHSTRLAEWSRACVVLCVCYVKCGDMCFICSELVSACEQARALICVCLSSYAAMHGRARAHPLGYIFEFIADSPCACKCGRSSSRTRDVRTCCEQVV